MPVCIPGYQFIREIRGGGQGMVYQAVHEASDADVAIKAFHVRDGLAAADFERFTREAESLRGISHANVVAIREAGVTGRTPYIVMAYVEGCSLDEFVASRPLDQASAIRIFERLCDAVHAAHVRGVIHRDLKPGNVRVDDRGDPHVLDFGLAKMLGPVDSQAAITHTGQFLGTLPWASPEQVDGRTDGVDARTDVYALGALLFYMLTGRAPIDMAGSNRDVLNRIANDPPLRPRELRADISGDVQTIILKCLAKEKERRYQSASELAAEARRWLAGRPIEAKRDSMVYVARKFVARNRVAVALSATLAVAAIGAGALFAQQARFEQREAAYTRSFKSGLAAIARPSGPGVAPSVATTFDHLRRLMPDHPREVGVAALALHAFQADLARERGQYRDAMASRRLALGEAIAVHGAGSEEAIQCRSQLALEALYAGELDAAEREAREAIALAIRHLPPATSTRAVAYTDLAWILLQKGELDTAVDGIHSALVEGRRALTANSGDLAGHLKSMAEMLYDVGCRRREQGVDAQPVFAEAEVLHREALEQARAVWRVDPVKLAHFYHSYSVFLRETGRPDEAEHFAQEALAGRLRIALDAPDVYFRCASMGNLGVIRMYQGRYREAEELLVEAFRAIRKGPYDAVHRLRTEQAGHLAELHARWAAEDPEGGHEEEARRWRQMAGGS